MTATYTVQIVACPSCRGRKYITLIENDELLLKTTRTHPVCVVCKGTGKMTEDEANALAAAAN